MITNSIMQYRVNARTLSNNINSLMPRPMTGSLTMPSVASITRVCPQINYYNSRYHQNNVTFPLRNKMLQDNVFDDVISKALDKHVNTGIVPFPIIMTTLGPKIFPVPQMLPLIFTQPYSLLFNEKELINHHNEKYKTVLYKGVDSMKISEKTLCEELRNRKLIGPIKNEPKIALKTENDEDVILGSSLTGMKLKPLAVAYSNRMNKRTEISVLKNQDDFDITKVEFLLAVTNIEKNNCFMETAKQKHIIIVHEKNKDEYYAMAYLTSKQLSRKFYDIKFKEYQDNKVFHNVKKPSNASQNFVTYENLEKISVNDLQILKYSSEYIKDSNNEELLRDIFKQLLQENIVQYNNKGLTKEDCINICLEYDTYIECNKPQPLTEDQILQNELNKENNRRKGSGKNNNDNESNNETDL